MPSPFDRVYASPDDDEPRARLAAELHGEPRGRFVALQLARGTNKRATSEEKALLAAHAATFAAPLGDLLVASTLKWERGFPVSGRVNLTGKRWKDLAAGAPLDLAPLATLRALDLRSANQVPEIVPVERLVLHPALRHLREIDGLPRQTLPRFARADPAFGLERIAVRPSGGGGLEGEIAERAERTDLEGALREGAGLPALRDLELAWNHGAEGPTAFAWVWTSSTGRALSRLQLSSYYFARTIAAWQTRLSATESRALALSEIAFRWGKQHELWLSRSSRGWDTLRGDVSKSEVSKSELVSLLEQLPGAFETIEVRGRPG